MHKRSTASSNRAAVEHGSVHREVTDCVLYAAVDGRIRLQPVLLPATGHEQEGKDGRAGPARRTMRVAEGRIHRAGCSLHRGLRLPLDIRRPADSNWTGTASSQQQVAGRHAGRHMDPPHSIRLRSHGVLAARRSRSPPLSGMAGVLPSYCWGEETVRPSALEAMGHTGCRIWVPLPQLHNGKMMSNTRRRELEAPLLAYNSHLHVQPGVGEEIVVHHHDRDCKIDVIGRVEQRPAHVPARAGQRLHSDVTVGQVSPNMGRIQASGDHGYHT